MHFVKTIHKKWWFWVLAIPFSCWVLWHAYLYYDSWKYNAPYRAQYLRAVADYAQMQAEQATLEARYAADFDGGGTPQETWDMFVEALEEGDTDQAAQYYIVEEQKEATLNWEAVKERGAIDLYLSDFDLIIGGDMYPNGERFEFYTDDIDGGPGFVYMLVKNPITGVWKIEDL